MAAYPIPTSIVRALKPLSRRLILNRRGSTVWRIETESGALAVKLGYPIEATKEWSGQHWTALAPGREGVILEQLGGIESSYGPWEEGTWNIQPWREGVSLYDLWQKHRKDEPAGVPNLSQALSCAEALAELHSKGWVHGDVQPAHFILGDQGTFLIDLALARGGEIPETYDFKYRGCLVHYESPEISASVLQSGTAIPTTASDVYALGASLFISATGKRHVAYPDDASRAEQRVAVVQGPHRPVTIPGILGKLIDSMMAPKPGDRPTATEVCVELQRVV